MRIIKTIILILSILGGCSKESVVREENLLGKELYVSSYSMGSLSNQTEIVSDIIIFDEDLNFLDKVDSGKGMHLSAVPERKELYLFGGYNYISKLDVLDKNIKTFNYEKIIFKGIEYISDTVWGLDRGYVDEEGKYKSNIINLDENKNYTYDECYFDSYSIKDDYIYIFAWNGEQQKIEFDLIKFNTEDESSEVHRIEGLENDINFYFKIFALEEELILINSQSFRTYKIDYDDLEKANYYGNLSEFDINIDTNSLNNPNVYDFEIELDENNILIGLYDGSNSRLVKMDKNSLVFTEILKGEGEKREFTEPVIDGDYLYISFNNEKGKNTISKYNWRKEELIKKINLDKYVKGNARMGSIEMFNSK